MKNLILAFSFLASVSAFASTVTITPDTPVIMTSDYRAASGEYISAPSFQATFQVAATEVITITGATFTVQGAQKDPSTFSYYLAAPTEIAAGATYLLPLGNVYSIGPKDGTTVYNVTMEFQGWTGTATAPTGRLNLVKTFKTQ